jgi:antirestriction protein ArdC
MLDVMAERSALSIGRFSFGNQVMLAYQRPTATMAATFAGWQRVGRAVRKGEKAAWVLQPRPFQFAREKDDGTSEERRGVTFRALAVFTLEQTDGEELAALPCLGGIETPEDFAHTVEALRSVALGLEGAVVASIEIRARRPGDPSEAHGWYVPSERAIVVVTDGRTTAEQFKTLAHELGHAILHGRDDHHSRAHMEVEAESVAYVVCKALGLDTGAYSFGYVSGWAGKTEPEKLIQASGERIARAARLILDALEPADEAPLAAE